MHTLPFSYSNRYLFQQDFCLVFHDEKVDKRLTLYYYQDIINIESNQTYKVPDHQDKMIERYSGERLNSCHSLIP